jgi:hypothetical protein
MEPHYFQAFDPKSEFTKIVGEGSNTTSLVQCAIKLKEEANQEKRNILKYGVFLIKMTFLTMHLSERSTWQLKTV